MKGLFSRYRTFLDNAIGAMAKKKVPPTSAPGSADANANCLVDRSVILSEELMEELGIVNE